MLIADLRAVYDRHIQTIGESFSDFCGDVFSFKRALNLTWPDAVKDYERKLVSKEEQFKALEELKRQKPPPTS